MSTPMSDIEVGLSDEECEIRDVTRKFVEEVVRPAGIELDRLHDPADVIAQGSVLWRVFERYRELGLNGLESGEANVDPASSARIRYLVNEEIGWGDSGIAISLGVAGFPGMFAKIAGRPELIERFASPDKALPSKEINFHMPYQTRLTSLNNQLWKKQ